MYNLIQIQDAIKTVPLKDVMDYANGKNPQVPSYLALTELNRRKQLQDTAESFYGEPGTLKDQIQSSLTGTPQGMNPTQTPPGQIDITRTPPQLAPSLAPVQPTAAPQMVNPTAQPVMAARGGMMRSPDMARGLTSIPLSQFKRRNFVGGGIVAFADTPPPGRTVGQAAEEGFFERFFGDKRRPLYRDPVTGEGPPPVTEEQAAETERMRNAPRFRDAARSIADFFYLTGEGSLQNRLAEREARPTRDMVQASYSNEGRAYERGKLDPTKEGPLNAPKLPNQQQSATSSGQIEKPAPPAVPARQSVADRIGSGVPTNDELNAAIARQKILMSEFGVSQDPYADVRKRYEDIEKRRESRRAEEPSDRLMATLAAYSEAAPEKGLGYQMGQAAKVRTALVKEQEALKDKQDTEMASLYSSMAKEEDARKRGDMKAVETELANQKAHKIKIIELENQSTQAQAQMINAMANRTQAERGPQASSDVQMVERMMRDPNFKREVLERESRANLDRIRQKAIDEWIKDPGLQRQWENKGGLQGFINAQIGTQGGVASVPQNLPPKIVKDGKTYILNPQTGKYREQ